MTCLGREVFRGFDGADLLILEILGLRYYFSIMIAEKIPEIANLSDADKLLLANELWEAVAKNPDNIPFSEEHVLLIKERYRAYLENPDDVVTWEQIKQRLGKS